MATRSFDLALVDAEGHLTPATAELDFHCCTEGGCSKTEIRLLLRWSEGEASATGWNYFAALCGIRRKLTKFGLMPRCYGACRNLVMSGMCLDMTLGEQGYLAKLGQPARVEDLVNIFASGPEMDLATVEEQSAFNEEWLQSLEPPGLTQPQS